jgi:hypothetical protein
VNYRKFGPLADGYLAVLGRRENRQQALAGLRQNFWLFRRDLAVINFDFDGAISHNALYHHFRGIEIISRRPRRNFSFFHRAEIPWAFLNYACETHG